MIAKWLIKENSYYDSVTLMLVTKEIEARDDVENAVVVMGTDLNKDLLNNVGLLNDEIRKTTANDLIIAVKMKEDKFDEIVAKEDGAVAEDGGGYFRSVRVLPNYQLEVVMGTGTTIHFDFRSRLNTARFGRLQDEELFQNVETDGNYLIFAKAGKMPVKITAAEFMDLVLVDRRQKK